MRSEHACQRPCFFYMWGRLYAERNHYVTRVSLHVQGYAKSQRRPNWSRRKASLQGAMIRTNHPDIDTAIDRSLDGIVRQGSSDEEDYFANSRVPDYLPQLTKTVQEFLDIQQKNNRKVAVVTSGGTTVPLENNTVRFIDNFSAGTRGAISAQYFLEHGYALIFLYREFSLRPYSQHYSQKTIMELLQVDPHTGKVAVRPEYEASMSEDLKAYNRVMSDRLLLEVPFTTVNQYLYTLRMIGGALQPHGENALFYLAAAVSDFFLPTSRISEHKIQSKGLAKLVVDLDPVPKFLKSLSQTWTPGAMIVSFKLETDKAILLRKCHEALERYGHQLVVGNLLQTRKNEVYLVSSTAETHVVRDEHSAENIESKFLPAVIAMHDSYIERSSDASST